MNKRCPDTRIREILKFVDMNALYHELRTLTDNPHVWAAIETAAIEGAPAEMLRGLEKSVSILPAIPPGKRFAKECFWSKFQAKFVWHTAFGKDSARKDSAARWLRAMREAAQRRDKPWPPTPKFIPSVTMPEAWTGKDEKPGRVPRDGKI